jgi:prepilin-type N-terminal cleavage/methylation domain-containing protein
MTRFCNYARRPKRRGFSLIELVLVVMIITTLSAMALPRYGNSLAHWRVDSAARRVAADFMLARNVAKIKSSTQIIKFTTPGSAYQLIGYASLDAPASGYIVDLANEPYRATIVAVNLGGTDQVTFDRFGQPSVGGTIVVQSGQFTATIALNGQTGKAVVQ